MNRDQAFCVVLIFERRLRVQFHPSYGYEDFIEGLRPSGENGELTLVNGDFKDFCKKAGKWECDLYNYVTAKKDCSTPDISEWLDRKVGELKEIKEAFSDKEHWKGIFNNANPDVFLRDAIPPYCVLIDEINRAELSRVFGELLYALEYRGPKGMLKTQYSRLDRSDTAMIYVSDGSSRFFVPHNVFILGTMNTIDRSIESFDFALRRRFRWEFVPANLDVAKQWLSKNGVLSEECAEQLAQSVSELNKKLEEVFHCSDYAIGQAYLMKFSVEKRSLTAARDELWEEHIQPLLEEYFRGEHRDISEFKDAFYKSKSENV